MVKHPSGSESDTEAVGAAFAATLPAGAVVILEGPLGAGKTAFVRGMARGLGAAPGDVSSPTFTLLQEYAGRLTLFHADLYRLSPREVDGLGLLDVSAEGVLAVEWPDRWHAQPTDAIRVTIERHDADARTIVIAPPDYSTR